MVYLVISQNKIISEVIINSYQNNKKYVNLFKIPVFESQTLALSQYQNSFMNE